MAQPWYMYGITQKFGQNGENGVDLGTPFRTPITALYAGTVRWAGRTQWQCGSSGGEVTIVCNVPGQGTLTSYYLHMDSVTVKQGDQVPQGALIGYSGGQLSGGNWPVVNCYKNGRLVTQYSTGPHLEFGFNAPWVSGPGRNIDPTFAITQARNGTLPQTTPNGSTNVNATGTPLTTGGNNGISETAGQGGGLGPGANLIGNVYQIDPNAIAQSQLQFAGLSAKMNHTINQPTGFDGICETIDSDEVFSWNWYNPLGSLFASFKAIMIRGLGMFLAAIIFIFVFRSLIRDFGVAGNQSSGGGLIAKVSGNSAGGMGADEGALAEAPEALAL